MVVHNLNRFVNYLDKQQHVDLLSLYVNETPWCE